MEFRLNFAKKPSHNILWYSYLTRNFQKINVIADSINNFSLKMKFFSVISFLCVASASANIVGARNGTVAVSPKCAKDVSDAAPLTLPRPPFPSSMLSLIVLTDSPPPAMMTSTRLWLL